MKSILILRLSDSNKASIYALIVKALKTERHQKVVGALCALVFGIWLTSRLNFERSQVILGLISLTSIVVGVRLLLSVIRTWQVERHLLIQLIKQSSHRIVWVYSMVTVQLPFGIQINREATIYFKLDDKDEITIRVLEKDIKLMMGFLNQQLSHASFGYSEDKAQWYMANPQLLLQYLEE